MRIATYSRQLSQIIKQRNLMLIALLVSVGFNMLLVGLAYKLSGQYRTVIAPPMLEEAFWIENRKVSASYLQQMADYFSRLLLNTTAASSHARFDAVLSLVDNAAYADFQHLMISEEEQIKKNNFITLFTPVQYEVDMAHLMVEVIGDLTIFQGKQQVKQQRKTYQIAFSFSGKSGKLLVKGFEDVSKG